MNYLDRVKNIYSNQKQGDIYYHYLDRYISAPITALVSYTSLTPNMATLSMFFFGLAGALYFSFGSATDFIFGGLCFVGLIIADTIDGELARFHKTTSIFGEYFDKLAHYSTNSLMYIGLGLGVYSTYQEITIIYISCFVMVCSLIDQVSRDLLVSCGLAEKNHKKGSSDGPLTVMNGSHLRTIAWNTASHAAFFHIIVLTALLDIAISRVIFLESSLIITHSYILYFACVTVARLCFRIPSIYKLRLTSFSNQQ